MFGSRSEPSPTGRFLTGGRRLTFMRTRLGLADDHQDPMEYMGNLFDVAILIGVGFLVLALTGFGLNELLSKDTVTIVKNPGQANMEIITKQGQRIERLKQTEAQAQGSGIPVGTVYRLKDGSMVWVPGGETPAQDAAPVSGGTSAPSTTPFQQPGAPTVPPSAVPFPGATTTTTP
jgi:hypothetical protein